MAAFGYVQKETIASESKNLRTWAPLKRLKKPDAYLLTCFTTQEKAASHLKRVRRHKWENEWPCDLPHPLNFKNI
jgi:hypothetical protein